MGFFSGVIKISCFIALLAILLSQCPEHESLAPIQNHLRQYVNGIRILLNTSPLNWFHSEKDTDKFTGVYNVVRDGDDRLYTKDELAKYDGSEGSLGLYLAILGLVYDVSNGEQYYGPGKGYGFFAARDGTKAFMTGDFTEKGLIDEVIGLSPGQMLELERWIKFYDDTYIYKGKLVGNFYDERGQPTKALVNALVGIREGHREENEVNELQKIFPHCNSQFKQNVGGKVWCSDNSGGEKRNWVGVPRKFYMPGSTKPRCACVRDLGPPSGNPDSNTNIGDLNHPGLELYELCNPKSVSCDLPLNK